MRSVLVTYFKRGSGKYYAEGAYQFPKDASFWEGIWLLKMVLAYGVRPGLVNGSPFSFNILVREEDERGLPHLIDPWDFLDDPVLRGTMQASPHYDPPSRPCTGGKSEGFSLDGEPLVLCPYCHHRVEVSQDGAYGICRNSKCRWNDEALCLDDMKMAVINRRNP